MTHEQIYTLTPMASKAAWDVSVKNPWPAATMEKAAARVRPPLSLKGTKRQPPRQHASPSLIPDPRNAS